MPLDVIIGSGGSGPLNAKDGTTRKLFRLSTLLGLALWFGAAWAEQLIGRVVGIADGDTLTILTVERQQHRVRLSGIDAPEQRQAFGQVSRRHLSDLAYDKTVSVVYHKRDRYKRLLGKVLVNGTDAGLNQVKTDLACHYKRYEREQSPEDRVG
jgi:endonuclease YncB( thermonuclease family)